jgi:hypothetical protein
VEPEPQHGDYYQKHEKHEDERSETSSMISMDSTPEEVDRLLMEFTTKLPKFLEIQKIGKGKYTFGNTNINLKCVNGRLVGKCQNEN